MPPTARADDDIHVWGGTQSVWVLQARHAPAQSGRAAAPYATPQSPVWKVAYRRDGMTGEIGWLSPLGFFEISGDIACAAVRSESLHVVFTEGIHRSYNARGSQLEPILPGSEAPLALTTDANDDSLLAVVPFTAAMGQQPDDPNAQTERESESEIQTEDSPRLVVMRLTGKTWRIERPLPESIRPADQIQIIADGSRLDVFWSTAPDQPLLWSTARESTTDWTTPVQPSERPRRSCGPVVRLGDRTWVPCRARDRRLDLVCLRNGNWQPVATIHSPETSLLDRIDLDRLRLAPLADHWIGVWPTTNGASWARFDRNGNLVAEPHEIGAFRLRALAARRMRINGLVTVGALALILSTVYIRRRISVLESVVVADGYKLAGHGRRLAAFILDGLLILPAAAFSFAPIYDQLGIDQDLLVQLAQTDPRISALLLRRLAVVIAAYILYAGVFEAWWGATPGKRLLRCRVLTETGQPCRPIHAVVRNLLRCVELYPFVTLTWTILLVFFTRNRQRLGDLIGRTIVVQQVPGPVPNADPKTPE